jgi:pimeloyl-ACP methyl ester carboxylesterase
VKRDPVLVLLPGMDGSGVLFDRLLGVLREMDTLVLDLPQEGSQDYERLEAYVRSRLPEQEFVLLAESFSGGIAARLSQRPPKNMRGVIFVASFLSAPKRWLVRIAGLLPLRFLAGLPFTDFGFRMLLIGRDADDVLAATFKKVIRSVPRDVLKARLRVIADARYDGFVVGIPALYIAGTRDVLVGKDKCDEVLTAYPRSDVKKVDGPHFILQSRFEASGRYIRESYMEGWWR